MTHTNQTVDSIGTGNRFTYAAPGDSYLVARGVTVQSTDSSCIFGNGGGYRLEINGLVESVLGSGARLLGAGNTVIIGKEGVLKSTQVSSGSGHLYLPGGTNEVTNHGKLITESSVGVVAAGSANELFNDGLIKGSSGVFFFSGADNYLENAGRVISTAFDDENQNYRLNNAVFVETTDSQVINRRAGSILAVSSEGAGVAIAAGGAEVTNQGRISSTLWYGVDFFNMAAGDSGRLENSGLISGGEGSFRGNEAADFVTNTGTMKGDLVFNAGDDVLDGAKGKIVGEVSGGDGNDILRTGGGNQKIDGGANNDIIDGGKGVDELRGGTGLDRFVFATGYGKDEIVDFIRGSDLVDISGWKAIGDFQDVLSHAKDKSGDVWIVSGRDTLIIDNVAKADLVEADFFF
jgi:Ca2+-binding RTX toxin-like protein